MTAADVLAELSAMQYLLLALVENAGEPSFRTQYHPELSPLGWHLGHCLYIENYWLRETIGGEPERSARVQQLYVPGLTPKPQRGAALPKIAPIYCTRHAKVSPITCCCLRTHLTLRIACWSRIICRFFCFNTTASIMKLC